MVNCKSLQFLYNVHSRKRMISEGANIIGSTFHHPQGDTAVYRVTQTWALNITQIRFNEQKIMPRPYNANFCKIAL